MRNYARVFEGQVVELIELEDDIDIANLYHPSLIWVEVTGHPEVAIYWTATETAEGWVFAEYVAPPPTSGEVLIANSEILQAATQLAAQQKTALTNRIGTLNDAVELEMATPAEVAELPVRTAQLKAWKTYAVLLGRVTTQAGWHMVVDWPVQPAAGMDLTVSAASPVAAS